MFGDVINVAGEDRMVSVASSVVGELVGGSLVGTVINVVDGGIGVGVEVPKLIPTGVPSVVDCVDCVDHWLSRSLVCRLVHESPPVSALSKPVGDAVVC
jgi:hypothetical protein